MKGTSSKRKFIIASVIVGVVLLGAIISVVAVLAAGTQNLTSQVTVTYTVEDVSATVGVRYAVKNEAVQTGGSLTFTADQAEQAGGTGVTDTLTAIGELELSSTNNFVTFEYSFQNNGTLAFDATLTGIPETVNNMTLSWAKSTSKTDSLDGVTGFQTFTADTIANVTAEVAGDADVSDDSHPITYIYIRATITDLNVGASLSGNFAWKLAA